MVLERVQFFESVNSKILQDEINEFLYKLPSQFTEFVDIKYDSPFSRTVIYRLTKSEEELVKMAEDVKEEEKRKQAELDAKEFTDEELKAFAEMNKVDPKILEKAHENFEEGKKVFDVDKLKEKDKEND